jgi:hypothetical protein
MCDAKPRRQPIKFGFKMTLKITTYLILFFQTINVYGYDIFVKISNKTWFQENGFAGTTIVFYKTDNGLLKCIRQINGSGVPVVSSEIYDIEIQEDTIRLINGLTLKTSQKLIDCVFIFDNEKQLLFDKMTPLRILLEKPILFSWTVKRKNFLTKVNVNLLAKIPIQKNEIYKDSDIEEILFDD